MVHGEVVCGESVYRNLNEACIKLQLDYQKIYGRIRSGYSVEDALKGKINTKGNTNRREVEYRGTKYRSIYCMCKELNLEYNKTYLRIIKGYSIEDAVENNIANKKRMGVRVN